MGTLIRHARMAVTLPILPLPVAMIEPSLRTLLMTAIGRAPLAQPGLPAAGEAAIALPTITAGADKKRRTTFDGKANALPQNHFAKRRHAGSQAALDNDNDSVAG